jgi:hypothetical protein
MTVNQPEKQGYKAAHDTEFEGKKANHPYVWYIGLTTLLFLFLVGIAYLAATNGWVPTR